MSILEKRNTLFVANKRNFKGQGSFDPARLLADAQDEDPPC